MRMEGSSFPWLSVRTYISTPCSLGKLMAAMLRPPLYHRLTQALPAAPHGILPSQVGLEIKQRRSSAGRRLWATRRMPAINARAAAGDPEASSSGDGLDKTSEEIKAELYLALQGIDRGIFGLNSAKKAEIEAMIEQLESRNPTPNPTDHLLSKVDGCWKLVYTTVTILGSKRTMLGLRDFISLGDIYQTIDAAQERAVNAIQFNAKGLTLLAGRLTIQASYTIASKSRVDIKLETSSIAPDQLAGLYEKNYDRLIAVFNPEGWLDITYVDETMRIGRDDRGNIFILERATEEAV